MMAKRVLPIRARRGALLVATRATEALAGVSDRAVVFGISGSSPVISSRALSSSRVPVRFPHRLHRTPFMPIAPARVSTTTTTTTTRVLTVRASVSKGNGGSTNDNDNIVSIVEEGNERYLVAARDLRPDEVVFGEVRGKVSGEVTRHSIQVGPAQHLVADGDVILMNHSCAPSCQLEVLKPSAGKSPQETVLRVASRGRTIVKGELLTLDYNAMEINMVCAFDCACGAPNCKRHISGFANLSPASRQEYLEGHLSNVGAGDVAGVAIGAPPLTCVVQDWVQASSA